jgi:propanol-preferring alcohol dehydrogenase
MSKHARHVAEDLETPVTVAIPAKRQTTLHTPGLEAIPKTMKAAFVTEFGKPLTVGDLPVPQAKDGELLIKIEACGVCHTDIHAADGDWPVKPKLPFTPGHEGIGRIVAIGSNVKQIKEGEMVGVPWLFEACGLCDYCLTARETMCESALYGGYTANGGFAEYCVAPAAYVARIPDGLDPVAAGPIICAGVTTYKGIKVAECKPDDWFVVSGVGGLGHLAVQYAKAMGLRVAAVDIDDEKLALAKKLGASLTFNAKAVDAVAAIQKAIGGAHGVLITAVSEAAFAQGTGMLRRGGTCVLNGLPPGDFPLSIFDVVFRCLTVRGSLVGTRADMKEALAFAAEGKVKANIETQPLSAINDVFERLKEGKVNGRVVLKIASGAHKQAHA